MAVPDEELPLHVHASSFRRYADKALLYHERTPLLRKLPPRAVGIILLIAAVNIIVWIAVSIVLHFHGALVGTAVLAYTLGLRHALDADHISAIDLMTRRLVAANQRPVTVGTWFSLGHSTIVVITSIVVAATASTVSKKFGAFSNIGGIIGSSVSSTFLLILGLANAYIFFLLVRQMRKVLTLDVQVRPEFKIDGGGMLFRVFEKLFKLIDRPIKMYLIGVLFGLGFDTSSEIALLGISSIQAAHGTSLWLILIFPCLFTAGMCLLDTTDGALMMALYTSYNTGDPETRNPIRVLYYNVVLTGITVIIAVVIGVLQTLGMVASILGDRAKGSFWNGVAAISDKYDVVGGAICGLFVVVGVLSFLLYEPWRRWADRRKEIVVSLDVAESSQSLQLEESGANLEKQTVGCLVSTAD